MTQSETLLDNRFGIALSVALFVFGVLTRNIFLVLAIPGTFLVKLPLPSLKRALYSAIYFSLATAGLLLYAALRGALSGRVYFVAGVLALLATGGYGAYLYGKKHPEKNPDFRQ